MSSVTLLFFGRTCKRACRSRAPKCKDFWTMRPSHDHPTINPQMYEPQMRRALGKSGETTEGMHGETSVQKDLAKRGVPEGHHPRSGSFLRLK